MLRLKRSKNPLFWIAFFFWFPIECFIFYRLIQKDKIGLIHVNMESTIPPAIAGRLARIPVVIHYRGKTRDDPKWFFDLFLPALYRLADHIFVISNASAEGLMKRRLSHKTQVLYNAVDLHSFLAPDHESSFFESIPQFAHKKVITFIGRLDPQKRIVDIIDAAAILSLKRSDLAFAIVGGDPHIPSEASHKMELQRYLATKGPSISIYFLGVQHNISAILHSSEMLILPSINEGFGRVVVEAMACKTPVIVANSGALPELLKGGEHGTIVPPCSPEALAMAILKILEDPNRKEKAQRAQKHATDTFDIEQHVLTLSRKYRELLSESLGTNRT